MLNGDLPGRVPKSYDPVTHTNVIYFHSNLALTPLDHHAQIIVYHQDCTTKVKVHFEPKYPYASYDKKSRRLLILATELKRAYESCEDIRNGDMEDLETMLAAQTIIPKT